MTENKVELPQTALTPRRSFFPILRKLGFWGGVLFLCALIVWIGYSDGWSRIIYWNSDSAYLHRVTNEMARQQDEQIDLLWVLQDRVSDQAKIVSEQQAAAIHSLSERMDRFFGDSAKTMEKLTLIEVETLIRLAHDRLLYFQDPVTVKRMLEEAQRRVSSFKEPHFRPIQTGLITAIDLLEKSKFSDPAVVTFKIDQVSVLLDQFPMQASLKSETTPAAKTKNLSFAKNLEQNWEKLKKLVVIQKIDEKSKPFLLPEHHRLIIWSIRLELEQAKLALWRQNEEAYQLALKNSEHWMREYFNLQEAIVIDALQKLAELSAVSLTFDKPDLLALAMLTRNIRETENLKNVETTP